MKKMLYIVLTFSVMIMSCSSDDNDPRANYPKNVDIEFRVTSSDESRLSLIETAITNGVNEEGISSLDITTSSYSNKHLPFKKIYIHQTVKFQTTLLLSYSDRSSFPVGESFEPYTIELNILVNGENIATKEIEITDSRQVNSIDYFFQ